MSEDDEGVFCCWKCGKTIHVLPQQAGLTVECPHCHSAATVPRQLFGPAIARTIGPTTAPQKSPATAALLNFLLWGAGYIYAGKDWGWAILVLTIVLSARSLSTLPEMTRDEFSSSLLLSVCISLLLASHAYRIVQEQEQ